MFEAKAHCEDNYLYICIRGLFHMPEAEECARAVLAEAKKLKPGFAIINDISEARPSSPEVAEGTKKTQAMLFAMGATRVVRIVSSASAGASLQFARTQREASAAYESHLAATLDDALKLIAQ